MVRSPGDSAQLLNSRAELCDSAGPNCSGQLSSVLSFLRQLTVSRLLIIVNYSEPLSLDCPTLLGT